MWFVFGIVSLVWFFSIPASLLNVLVMQKWWIQDDPGSCFCCSFVPLLSFCTSVPHPRTNASFSASSFCALLTPGFRWVWFKLHLLRQYIYHGFFHTCRWHPSDCIEQILRRECVSIPNKQQRIFSSDSSWERRFGSVLRKAEASLSRQCKTTRQRLGTAEISWNRTGIKLLWHSRPGGSSVVYIVVRYEKMFKLMTVYFLLS